MDRGPRPHLQSLLLLVLVLTQVLLVGWCIGSLVVLLQDAEYVVVRLSSLLLEPSTLEDLSPQRPSRCSTPRPEVSSLVPAPLASVSGLDQRSSGAAQPTLLPLIASRTLQSC